MKVILSELQLLFVMAVVMLAENIGSAQSYTTTWIGNTYGDNTHHVGNCARSMWVATNGVIYTASLWDENAGGIGVYQNGQTLGSIGAHNEFQGCSITGNALWVFAEEQGSNGGQVARYNRSTLAKELMFSVSSTNGDSVPGLAISPVSGFLYASDNPGNRVRVFTTGGIWQRDWTVANPGALAIDNSGNVWVAQITNTIVREFSATGTPLVTILMPTNAGPSALYVDAKNQLWVGDEGPDLNIKIYTNLASAPVLVSTFGVTGGYLSTNGAVKGQTGAKRFTRVVGIGGDRAGNVYVLNNPWGGTWDMGRNGGTDIHCYNTNGTLIWTLQSVNFEGVAAADPATDGASFHSGCMFYSGIGGSCYVANTIDPFSYPTDPRINLNSQSRGEHFGMVADVSGHRILVACSQNTDILYSYYFNTNSGYVAIPGQTFTTGAHIRQGFQLEPSTGDIWLSYNVSNRISHYPLTGFSANGQPVWGAPMTVPVPASIGQLNRLGYSRATDTMVLAGGSTDWTSIGSRVEVYKGWLAGNTNSPNVVITLNTNLNPKSLAVAGNYMFVGYVHTVPNIDVFNLTTGNLELSMTNADPTNVYVGNDVDSMYGVTAYEKSNGQYIVCKDNYNSCSVIVHTFTPAGLPVVNSISPSSPLVGSSSAQPLAIAGLNFQSNSVVTLSNLDTGNSTNPAAVFVDSSNMTVNVTLPAAAHTWSIMVTNPSNIASAPLQFSVQAPPPPVITDVRAVAGNARVVLAGTNGTAGLTYVVLTSTNLAWPLSRWMPIATNVFGPGGGFSWTNTANVFAPGSFFVIKP